MIPVCRLSENVNGLTLVHREAGPKDAPAIVPPRGLPSGSHMFRTLIPSLAERSASISELDAGESVFVTTRPRLFAIAYRFLGDVGEAEDVVQETWLRWERVDRSVVINPPAFLAMTTTRLALNVAQSARRRRETSVGPWLVERDDGGAGLETAAERHEAVDLAIRLLLEKLSPAERAAYLLRKAFDYPYRRISEVLHLGADHARQLVRRAHERIATGRRQSVDITAHQRLVQAFLDAARTGDLAELEGLLAADIPMRSS